MNPAAPIRGSVIGTSVILLLAAFVNAIIVATATTPPPWGWARLLMAFVLAVAAIRLLLGELRSSDTEIAGSAQTLER